MKIFSLFLKKSPFGFLFAAIFGALSGFMITRINKSIHEAVETQLSDPDSQVFWFVLYWAGYGLTSFGSVWIMTNLSEDVVLDLRRLISGKILKASFQSMEMERNRLFTILTADISTISGSINKLPNMLSAISTIIGCLVYMFFVSRELMGMFVILLVVALLVFKLPMNAFRERVFKSREVQNRLFGYFEALISGLKELSLSYKLRQSFQQDLLDPACVDQRNHNVQARVRFTFIAKWGEMLLLMGLGVMAYMVFINDWGTPLQFEKFLTTALLMVPALQWVSNFLPNLSKIDVALDQIYTVGFTLDQSAEHHEHKVTLVEQANEPLIHLEEVSFSYFHAEEKKFFKLGPLTLDIHQGEIVYLIGGNGSGKSTLAKVLCGLYEPESGQRYYAGNLIDGSNIDEYREYYSAIFFDFYLFEHLHHIKSDFWRDKAAEYLKLLELDKKVKIERDKLSTTSLSTGQRKRLVLLLSLLEDKPFYLFDEWAASQDPYYKNVFYKKILPDLKAMGKTLFVITHDEQYFDCADRILLLQEGKLVTEQLPDDIISFYVNEKPA